MHKEVLSINKAIDFGAAVSQEYLEYQEFQVEDTEQRAQGK